jgi:hypothetical protein
VSEVLGAFGLLDFTMLRAQFEAYERSISINFQIVLRDAVSRKKN